MTHESVTTNVYDELDVIREAAQLLARRYSMIADALLESTGVFWEVIHEDRLTDWRSPCELTSPLSPPNCPPMTTCLRTSSSLIRSRRTH
jgi:hypothetical protein